MLQFGDVALVASSTAPILGVVHKFIRIRFRSKDIIIIIAFLAEVYIHILSLLICGLLLDKAQPIQMLRRHGGEECLTNIYILRGCVCTNVK